MGFLIFWRCSGRDALLADQDAIVNTIRARGGNTPDNLSDFFNVRTDPTVTITVHADGARLFIRRSG